MVVGREGGRSLLNASLYHGYMLTLLLLTEWVRGKSKDEREGGEGGREGERRGRL